MNLQGKFKTITDPTISLDQVRNLHLFITTFIYTGYEDQNVN